MEDRVLISLITVIGTSTPLTITAIAGFWKIIRNQRIAREESKKESLQVQEDLNTRSSEVKGIVVATTHFQNHSLSKLQETTEKIQKYVDGNLTDAQVKAEETRKQLDELYELMAAMEPSAIETAKKRLADQKKGYD